MINYHKLRKEEVGVVKLHYEKAFDHVSLIIDI